MTTRYTEKQIEDVAGLLAGYTVDDPDLTPDYGARAAGNIALEFADLFAADNPPVCSLPDDHVGDCEYTGGKATTGFNREQFLAACGLESEG